MGGGTSNLFYGTKGARQEYQYTLFTDKPTEKSKKEISVASPCVDMELDYQVNMTCKKKITVTMVIRKCHSYYDKKITEKQLVNWLDAIISDLNCEIGENLRHLIVSVLHNLKLCLANVSEVVMFSSLVHNFEKRLYQLL